MERIEQLNHERIKTFGEKENYKYLWILEADIFKQAKEKDAKKKRVALSRGWVEFGFLAYQQF